MKPKTTFLTVILAFTGILNAQSPIDFSSLSDTAGNAFGDTLGTSQVFEIAPDCFLEVGWNFSFLNPTLPGNAPGIGGVANPFIDISTPVLESSYVSFQFLGGISADFLISQIGGGLTDTEWLDFDVQGSSPLSYTETSAGPDGVSAIPSISFTNNASVSGTESLTGDQFDWSFNGTGFEIQYGNSGEIATEERFLLYISKLLL